MKRNPEKPLCCYRHYQKISEDIGLSARYIGRIVEILDKMNIIKFKKMKRIKYHAENKDAKFSTAPKIFADYRHFKKLNNISLPDDSYDYEKEIFNQIELLEEHVIVNPKNK